MSNYSRIERILGENKGLQTSFVAINNKTEHCKLLEDLYLFLDDVNPLSKSIQDNKIVEIVEFIKAFYLKCGNTFLFEEEDYEKIFNGAKRVIYGINAPLGFRIATQKEVDYGVIGLVQKEEYLISEDKYKLLALLNWTLTGRLRYYKLAGYEYNYDTNSGLVDTIYELIERSYGSMIYMLEWVGGATFDAEIKALKKVIKGSKYKYPEYAEDEVTTTITPKQIVYYLEKNLPRNSSNINYRRAIAIILSGRNDASKLDPVAISFLRGVYEELTTGMANLVGTGRVEELIENNPIKDKCLELLKARDAGYIEKGEFVFKIVDTLVRCNFNKCSRKQLDIIDKAIKTVKDNKEKVDGNTEEENNLDIMADTFVDNILDMSNSLGVGDFKI